MESRRAPAPTELRGGVLALLAFAAIVQIALLPRRGPDTAQFENWARWSVAHGPLGVYKAPLDFRIVDGHPEGMDERPDYPPLAIYTVALSGAIYSRFDPGMRDTRLFAASIKFPIVIASAAFLAALFWLRRRIPAAVQPSTAAATVIAFALNPALIVSGPLLGYLESLFWAPAAASLMLASSGAATWAGVCIGVALLMKPQAAFFVVPLATILWSTPRLAIRAALTCAITIALGAAPFVATGNGGAMIHEVVGNATAEDSLLSQATNVWWIATHAASVDPGAGLWRALQTPVHWMTIDRMQAIAGFDVYRAAAVAVIAVALALAWRVRRQRGLAVHCAMGALVVHVYFTFAVGVHENHLEAAIPLLGLTALTTRAYRPLFWMMSALVFANLTVFYGLGEDFNPWWMRTWFAVDGPLALAVANLGLLGWHGWTFVGVTEPTPSVARSSPYRKMRAGSRSRRDTADPSAASSFVSDKS